MFAFSPETVSNIEDMHSFKEVSEPEISEVDEARESNAAELMHEVFSEDVIENWTNYSPEQKEKLLDEYSEKLAESLGVDSLDVIIEPMEPGLCGYTNGSDGTIHISETLVNDPNEIREMLDTVVHETRHCFQKEAVRHPENYPDIPQELLDKWQYEFDHYIDSSYDYEGYYNQLIETDARDFAKDVLDQYAMTLDV